MKNRFILIIDSPSKEQQDSVTQFFREQYNQGQDCSYWHWFSDLWLLVDNTNTWTVDKLRDKIKELIPGAHLLVFLVEKGNLWSGFGPKKMGNWLYSTWQD